MIITKTPFRMSFFGGGTDMESFFNKYGGAVLSTTIDKYCYVNVRHLPRFFDYTSEIAYSKIERVKGLDDIEHPLVATPLEDIEYTRNQALPWCSEIRNVIKAGVVKWVDC